MAIRKAIGNALRVSIFTRDHFTCQYCGRRAPTVALHVEHLISVFDGGSNHPANLATSCADCNYGKGKRSLIVEELTEIVTAPRPPKLPTYTPLNTERAAWVLDALEVAHSKSFAAFFLGHHGDDVLCPDEVGYEVEAA
jgi:ribosomal protein L37E